MPELLVEILSEEIPAHMQSKAADNLKLIVSHGLKEVGLDFSKAESYATPRRLALVIDGLNSQTSGVKGERKGPKTDAPEKAVSGFKRSLPEGAVIEERSSAKGNFFFASWEEVGRDTPNVLADCLPNLLQALPWPKSMRWGSHELRWVRPIHSLIAVFDGQPVPFQFGPFVAGAETYGHRFLSEKPFVVSNFAQYRSKLAKEKVILDPAERRALILTQATELAESKGLMLADDPALLNEVANLVEWPMIYMGSIDDAFMEIPTEVLITSMKSHQKYFPCLDARGVLANRFIIVANMDTKDGGAHLVAGNERVLRARLSDAKFFWDQDRKTSLADKVSMLEERVFHAKLGSMAEKVRRIEALSAHLTRYVLGADKRRVRRAAQLAKADLSTSMVGEFASLQGVMGRHYALNDGEQDAVAEAIAVHYAPQGPGEICPSAPVGVCIALADKIDSLVSLFAIHERPTGSKDPFALRRAALGVVRLILENGLRIPLMSAFAKAHVLVGVGKSPAEDLLAFFADRLKVHLKERGVSNDCIDAVFAPGNEDDLVRMLDRVNALMAFLTTDDGENLLTAYRRAANILKIEEKVDARAFDGEVNENLFVLSEEKALAISLSKARAEIIDAIRQEDFTMAMTAVAALRRPVDAFFDQVKVNVNDAKLRENRLKLLNKIREALNDVADFSKIS